jgi:hypothetical protein
MGFKEGLLSMVKANVLAPAAIALGIVLLAASVLWSYLVDPREYWTEKQAEHRAESGVLVKTLPHKMEKAATDAERRSIEIEMRRAAEQFNQTDVDLENARARIQRPISLLRWSGTVCLLVGVVAYYALRGRDE